jgi:hypothetical protein
MTVAVALGCGVLLGYVLGVLSASDVEEKMESLHGKVDVILAAVRGRK